MSDPAIEAAQRAWAERYGENLLSRFFEDCDDEENVAAFVTAAAREALKPIREKCSELREFANSLDGVGMSETVIGAGIRHALDSIAELIYTSEEIEHG